MSYSHYQTGVASLNPRFAAFWERAHLSLVSEFSGRRRADGGWAGDKQAGCGRHTAAGRRAGKCAAGLRGSRGGILADKLHGCVMARDVLVLQIMHWSVGPSATANQSNCMWTLWVQTNSNALTYTAERTIIDMYVHKYQYVYIYICESRPSEARLWG